jgi:hypothetical protein
MEIFDKKMVICELLANKIIRRDDIVDYRSGTPASKSS